MTQKSTENKNNANQNRLDFNFHVHSYLSNHILIADAKSGFTSVVVLALLALVNQEYTKYELTPGLFYPAVVFLIASLFACVSTIFPRFLWIKKGFVSSEDILTWDSAHSYIKEFNKLGIKDLVRVITRENYELSQVVRIKYVWFRLAIYSLSISVILLLLSRVL